MREGDWKLIEYYAEQRFELYNLKDDPSETENLASREPARVKSLSAALRDWRKNVRAQENSFNPNFRPELARPIYEDLDVSRYEPAKASDEEFRRMLQWRKEMDAVLRLR